MTLAVGPGREINLHLAVFVVNAISRFHIVGIDVGKPANTATRSVLEILTVFVKENEVVL